METEVIETEPAEEITEEATVEEETTLEEGAEGPTLEAEVEDEDEAKKQRDSGFLKRINKITYQREEEKRRADALQEKLDAALKTPKVETPQGKPNIDDFDTDAEFYDSLTDWKLEQRDATAAAKRQESETQRTQDESESAFKDSVVKVNESGVKKYADYEEIVFSLPPDVLDNNLAAALFETEAPEEIAYHLGKNPKAAARISKLSPVKKAIELGKIEERLSQKKKTTGAFPPIKPLKGKDSTEFDEEKLSNEEWIRLKNEGKI